MAQQDRNKPAIAALDLPASIGAGYPDGFRELCAAREKRRLGDGLGIDQFGVNLVRLPPGTGSSLRHWHTHEDELVYVLSGEITLITDAGETLMTPGMIAGFKAGVPDGHHLVNKSSADATYLEIGSRNPLDGAEYPDLDLRVGPDGKGGRLFTDKAGKPL